MKVSLQNKMQCNDANEIGAFVNSHWWELVKAKLTLLNKALAYHILHSRNVRSKIDFRTCTATAI